MNFALVMALLLWSPQRIHTADNSVTAPQIAAYTDPFYTRAARQNRIEGSVIVEGTLDADGELKVTRVLKELGYGLDQNELEALRKWRFCPATRGGKPVESLVQIEIDFRLADLPPAEFDDVQPIGGSGTTPPIVSKRIQPQYTDEAKAAHATGMVVLQAVVQADGKPKILKVVQFVPNGLTESAIQAIEQWTFTPAMKAGKAISVSTLIEVGFNLEATANLTYPRCSSR